MNRITDRTIATVRARATLSDLAADGRCPECSGTNIEIDFTDRLYRCQCGEGGDVVTYWQRRHGLTFNATIRDLASRYGVSR